MENLTVEEAIRHFADKEKQRLQDQFQTAKKQLDKVFNKK